PLQNLRAMCEISLKHKFLTNGSFDFEKSDQAYQTAFDELTFFAKNKNISPVSSLAYHPQIKEKYSVFFNKDIFKQAKKPTQLIDEKPSFDDVVFDQPPSQPQASEIIFKELSLFCKGALFVESGDVTTALNAIQMDSRNPKYKKSLNARIAGKVNIRYQRDENGSETVIPEDISEQSLVGYCKSILIYLYELDQGIVLKEATKSKIRIFDVVYSLEEEKKGADIALSLSPFSYY
ncbi:MAG: hypothetical protein K2X39_03990, partial [Silvanigrellaceae bacterium]|nr:hypothetical protein [Silvanigrellaceae bacterium]